MSSFLGKCFCQSGFRTFVGDVVLDARLRARVLIVFFRDSFTHAFLVRFLRGAFSYAFLVRFLNRLVFTLVFGQVFKEARFHTGFSNPCSFSNWLSDWNLGGL